MICPNCNNKTFFLVSGECPKCQDKSVVSEKVPRRGNNGRKISKCQRASTIGLIAECAKIMSEMGIKPYRFAKLAGLTPSSFYRWYNGEFTIYWQLKFNEKVKESLGNGTFRLGGK
ncbi:MAG: helix-turn-helix domain-containing protein [Rickettsiales bacterium]